jgi:hypothetical protein
MSTRVTDIIATLNEKKQIALPNAALTAEDASLLADALKTHTSVTSINLSNDPDASDSSDSDSSDSSDSSDAKAGENNAIGDEGASVLAEALKTNTSATSINLAANHIGAEGASALADALRVNMTVTHIDLKRNDIDEDEIDVFIGSAFFDALQMNTSVTSINIGDTVDILDDVLARNKQLRRMFLFDTRKMLLSVVCSDLCGVVWPYLLDSGDTDGMEAPDNIDELRAEFAAVVEKRRGRFDVALWQLDLALLNECNDGILVSIDANVMSVQAAIAAGADVNFSQTGWSCLFNAVEGSHHEIVGQLLNAGVDVDAKDERGSTALMQAASNDQVKCVELLLTAGADKDAKDIYGFTALFCAMKDGNNKCVKLLLKAGVDKKAKTQDGFTALVVAALEGHYKCVKLLLTAGVDKEAKTQDGCTALMCCTEGP